VAGVEPCVGVESPVIEYGRDLHTIVDLVGNGDCRRRTRDERALPPTNPVSAGGFAPLVVLMHGQWDSKGGGPTKNIEEEGG